MNHEIFEQQFILLRKILIHYNNQYPDVVWFAYNYTSNFDIIDIIDFNNINRSLLMSLLKRSCACISSIYPDEIFTNHDKIQLIICAENNAFMVKLKINSLHLQYKYVDDTKYATSANVSNYVETIQLNMIKDNYEDYLAGFELLMDVVKNNHNKIEKVNIDNKKLNVHLKLKDLDTDFEQE